MTDSTPEKSHAEKMLDAIEALLEGRAIDEYKSLQINNRRLDKHSFAELKEMRDYYRAEITRVKIRKCGTFQRIGYKF